MRNITLCSEETLQLVSYVKERFENEPEAVQSLREEFAKLLDRLIQKRNSVERWEKSRNLQIAITHLEDACMRAIKAEYL